MIFVSKIPPAEAAAQLDWEVCRLSGFCWGMDGGSGFLVLAFGTCFHGLKVGLLVITGVNVITCHSCGTFYTVSCGVGSSVGIIVRVSVYCQC